MPPQVAPACNPAAAQQGGLFALLMCLAALGYIIADVAADGLTVRNYIHSISRAYGAIPGTLSFHRYSMADESQRRNVDAHKPPPI